MTLRAMEIFLAVVNNRSMSKAAEILHISQPTISQAIKEIEVEYGLVLFNRIGKNLYITDEGKRLTEFVKTIWTEYTEMNQCMANILTNSKIYLGATITIGQTVLIKAVQEFENDNAGTTINVIVDNTSVIEKLLIESKIDMAFVEGKVKHADLVSIPLVEDFLVVAFSKNHPLRDKECIVLKDLLTYSFAVREEGSGTREIFQQILNDKSISIDAKWVSHSFDSILSAVEYNQAITVISKRIALKYSTMMDILYKEIMDIPLTRQFSLVYHKNKKLNQRMNILVDYFKQFV